MDENKDFVTAEQKAEELTDTVADTETTAEETAEAAQDAVEEAAETAEAAQDAVEEAAADIFTDTEAAAQAPKKSFVLQRTIIISVVIVVIALLAVLIVRLFVPGNSITNTNILGGKASTSWHYIPMNAATEDEAQEDYMDVFFIFDPDGRVRVKCDHLESIGTYSIQHVEPDDKENAGKPYLMLENTGVLDGSFFYETTGNAFTERTMTLTSMMNASAPALKFDQKKTYKAPEIEREGEFTGDDALNGSWKISNEAGSTVYDFSSDGTYTMEARTAGNNGVPGSINKISGIYNCKDGVLTTSTIYMSRIDNSLKYKVDGDELHFYVQALDPATGQLVENDTVFKKN